MSEQLIQTPGVFGDNGNFLLERELGAGGMGSLSISVNQQQPYHFIIF